uniref:(northern house mosquito) hypothetical protein n=1 Tax=Culex pipiens TaxID=7175 RepID=A0A8D8FAZ4_CULPI
MSPAPAPNPGENGPRQHLRPRPKHRRDSQGEAGHLRAQHRTGHFLLAQICAGQSTRQPVLPEQEEPKPGPRNGHHGGDPRLRQPGRSESSHQRVEHPGDSEPVRGQPGEPKVCRVPNQGGRRGKLPYNGVHRRGRDHSDQRRFDSFTVMSNARFGLLFIQ